MDASARKIFNAKFTTEKYKQFLDDLNVGLQVPTAFRIAETPIFLTTDFKSKLVRAGQDIIDTILQPNFKEFTERAIPHQWYVANENAHPHFIALDFGVCKDEEGSIVPKLIELQGFPSLFGFTTIVAPPALKVSAFSRVVTMWPMMFCKNAGVVGTTVRVAGLKENPAGMVRGS